MAEERAPVPLAPVLGEDEEVFQVEAWFAKERGVVVKVEREGADLPTVLFDQRHFRPRVGAEEVLAQVLLRADDLVLQSLVARQGADEGEESERVGGAGGANQPGEASSF